MTTTHVGGATEADYEGVPPSVTFEPGETEEIFRVRAVNDDVDDDCEAVIIGFGTMPSGVSPGRYPTLRIELRDDDGIATWLRVVRGGGVHGRGRRHGDGRGRC